MKPVQPRELCVFCNEPADRWWSKYPEAAYCGKRTCMAKSIGWIVGRTTPRRETKKTTGWMVRPGIQTPAPAYVYRTRKDAIDVVRRWRASHPNVRHVLVRLVRRGT
jgi:hypothetical protein